ncbi:MAG: hypothetical protein DCC67_19450 [Planctomycetota bacterium]|nr:MAG: hypothetical protein DCC67_19450 [Planctomycetota bacterium]
MASLSRAAAAALSATILVLLVAPGAHAQFLPETFVIDSFEDGVANWMPETANTIYLNHAQSNTGPTRGTKSMLLDLYGTHQRNPENPVAGVSGWGVSRGVDPSDTTGLYDAFNAVAANPSAWNLVFDVTLDPTSWANVTVPTGPPIATQGGWSFLNLGFNNDGGFSQVGPVSPSLVNQQGKFRIQVGMEQLTTWQADSSFYQFFLGANNRFLPQPGVTPGPPPSGSAAKYYIDNIRFKPKAPMVGHTLFSWETVDNPATTGVNEALENWSDAGLNEPAPPEDPGDAYAHKHSVTTVGATHGSRALKIDTTIQDPAYQNPLGIAQDYRFHWGSNMVLNADTNPDPDVETIDPAIQSQVTNMIRTINKGAAIAFDLTFSDPFATGEFQTSALPSFLLFHLHISDERGTFFQADLSSIANDGSVAQTLLLTDDPREPLTLTVPLSQFADLGTTQLGSLATAKLQEDSSFLRIGLAVNANGPAVIHMDNFRVMIETSLDADFDNDGDVDGADLPLWKAAFGVSAGGDANDDGVTDGADLLVWQRQFGNDATPATPNAAGVPEPASAALLAWASSLAAASVRRRKDA